MMAIDRFRRGADGRVLRSGFGELVCVLKWVVERAEDSAAVTPPIGSLTDRRSPDLPGSS
jgi:GTP-dependent phosphoenolpyruvate carboxykinase